MRELREPEPEIPAAYPNEQIQRAILELLLSAHLLSLAQETKPGFEERQQAIEVVISVYIDSLEAIEATQE